MRRLPLLIAFLCLLVLAPNWADAYEVLILQSSRAPAYDEALRGFRAVRRLNERVLVLNEYADFDLKRIVREDRPLMIVALGDNAYLAASKIRHLPVVVLMSPNYRGNSNGHPLLAGIDLNLPPERYLTVLSAMKVKQVGIIGNPAKSGNYIRRVQQIAIRYGIEPVVREVNSAKEVAGQLTSLKGVVDALWLLPDDTAVAREATDAYFLFSLNQQVPVVAFSSAYLALGAAVAVEADRYDMGRQAGEMAHSILRGEEQQEQMSVQPRKSLLKTNLTVIRRLNLPQDIVVRAEGGR